MKRGRKVSSNTVAQFLIILAETDPPVWRRIQVPETYSFWDLHVAIQDAMGWLDYHLHEFHVLDPSRGTVVRIGISDEEDFGQPDLVGSKVPIVPFATESPLPFLYDYDFGDNWRHVVVFETIDAVEPSSSYPRCIGGARKCPPEDCGGVGGFAEFLLAIKDKDHEEHDSLLEWVGGSFDPSDFDPKAVKFDDPAERLKMYFQR